MERVIDPEMDRKIANEPKDHIPGWGMDADPENDPTYPMKHWTGADHERIHYERAPQQPINMEVFHSIERPTVTRVFGTSTPPAGLSGAIRRHAFKYSEATAAHWMTLILADRVDVIQGIINDLKHGIIPNLFAELGWRAEWQHNRKKFIGRIATKVLTIAVIAALLTRKKEKGLKSKIRSII
ncbi:MAG: hypothetical protein ICV51_04845 [Flavisolibacter sp.]|nr:hypothetical protein [Flavisolibacter sp.]MBD0284844.1 hypothetical protein [Flavisolibacter sp.]MBD0298148.1 hypothetical protein [Flavisolibacter sp.]MBD0350972.1 hypothetical protein [Flavisolibacter sp.]MBD0364834.1 hypothetical protein [Flavisolibacter sp.]